MVPAKPVIPCMMLDKSMTRKNTAYPIIYYLLSFLYSIRRLAAPGHPFAPSVLAYPNIHSRLSPLRPLYHISCVFPQTKARTPNPSGKMPGYNLRVHPRSHPRPGMGPRSTGGPIRPQEDTHPSFPWLQGRPGPPEGRAPAGIHTGWHTPFYPPHGEGTAAAAPVCPFRHFPLPGSSCTGPAVERATEAPVLLTNAP